mmetsp:Transcript_21651/g.30972  ORF Transcript_21651/g.30972 Transcript_21651/m.30972 type:complete len:89 (-) Transcript_21651:716-982(-)
MSLFYNKLLSKTRVSQHCILPSFIKSNSMIIRNFVASSCEWQEHVYGSLPFYVFAPPSMWVTHWLLMVELGRDYWFDVFGGADGWVPG